MAASMCNLRFVRRKIVLSIKGKTNCCQHVTGRYCSKTPEEEDADHGEPAYQSPLFAEDDYFGVSVPEEQWSVPRLSGLSKDELFQKYRSESLSETEKHNMHFVNMRFGTVRLDNVTDLKHQKVTREKFHDLNQIGVKTGIPLDSDIYEPGTKRSGQKYFVSFIDQFQKESEDPDMSESRESAFISSERELKLDMQKNKLYNSDVDTSGQQRQNRANSRSSSHVDKQTTPTRVEYGDSNLKFSGVSNVNKAERSNKEFSGDGREDFNFIDQQYFQEGLAPMSSICQDLKKSADISEKVIPELDPDLLFSDRPVDKEAPVEKTKPFTDLEIGYSRLESESFAHTRPEKLSKSSLPKGLKTTSKARTKTNSERLPSIETVSSPINQLDSSQNQKFQEFETVDNKKMNTNDMNFIDQQFFGDQLTDDSLSMEISNESRLNDTESSSDMNYIDEEYFKEAISVSDRKPVQSSKSEYGNLETNHSYTNEKRASKKKRSDIKDDMDKRYHHLMQGKVMDVLERAAVLERKRARVVSERNENEDMFTTAYNTVQKLRLERNETTNLEGGAPLRDSKGMKVMKTTVPQLHKMTTVEIVHMITRHILYDRDDIVAIYKPYGLPTHGGPGVAVSVAQLLGEIGQNLPKKQSELYMIHRLDKETTGVMLLARTKEMAARLSEAFRERRVIKKYWVITKGIPSPSEGIIDIPMVEGSVDGRNRMALRPNFLPDGRIATKSSIKTFRAETYYKVKASHENSAIVECLPLTVFGSDLDTPIF
ncbi:uncharacterized protein [Argopecten irradians]|uniref:uncharacterized protein isoform X2 n=1 Tax=Argopecten irradians TaxID=31199 RepID=UPI003723F79F